MPIINADIQKALRQVGISKSERDIPLTERLEANDLSLDNALNVFLKLCRVATQTRNSGQ